MGLKMKRLIDTCVYFNRSLGKLPLPAPPAPPPGGGSVPGGACHADRLSSELRRGLPPPAGLSPESSTVALGRTWPGPQPAPPQPCTVCGHAGGGRRGGHHARHGPDPCHARTCPLFSERPRASTLAPRRPLPGRSQQAPRTRARAQPLPPLLTQSSGQSRVSWLRSAPWAFTRGLAGRRAPAQLALEFCPLLPLAAGGVGRGGEKGAP